MMDRRKMADDLGLNVRFEKGRDIPVRNCWHFSTDGNTVDTIFYDRDDFIAGMNRIFVVLQEYGIVILAFCLMDNHLHFILYGDFDACNRFMHEYVRRTSMHIQSRHGLEKHLADVPIHYQTIDTQRYLMTAICYVVKNPPVAGLGYTFYDYPWSSGALYFRTNGEWTSAHFMDACQFRKVADLSSEERIRLFRHIDIDPRITLYGDMIFPGEYIDVNIVESLFRSQRTYNIFMCISKEMDVESRGGDISRLSIPDSELSQHKRKLLNDEYGVDTVRTLNTEQRLRICKKLHSQLNCSVKQLARVCGLKYEEIKGLV